MKHYRLPKLESGTKACLGIYWDNEVVYLGYTDLVGLMDAAKLALEEISVYDAASKIRG